VSLSSFDRSRSCDRGNLFGQTVLGSVRQRSSA
jgi:hypothetical protein